MSKTAGLLGIIKNRYCEHCRVRSGGDFDFCRAKCGTFEEFSDLLSSLVDEEVNFLRTLVKEQVASSGDRHYFAMRHSYVDTLEHIESRLGELETL